MRVKSPTASWIGIMQRVIGVLESCSVYKSTMVMGKRITSLSSSAIFNAQSSERSIPWEEWAGGEDELRFLGIAASTTDPVRKHRQRHSSRHLWTNHNNIWLIQNRADLNHTHSKPCILKSHSFNTMQTGLLNDVVAVLNVVSDEQKFTYHKTRLELGSRLNAGLWIEVY